MEFTGNSVYLFQGIIWSEEGNNNDGNSQLY